MARVTIRTLIPANTEIGAANAEAKASACDAMNLVCVESHLEVPDGQDPADHTLDRTLVSVWDIAQ